MVRHSLEEAFQRTLSACDRSCPEHLSAAQLSYLRDFRGYTRADQSRARRRARQPYLRETFQDYALE